MSERTPAHLSVDSETVEAVPDRTDEGLATVRFLSAPPGDPVADALPSSTGDDGDGAGESDDSNGTAFLAGGTGLDDALDWLHRQGKRQAGAIPEFDVEETLRKVRADQTKPAMDWMEAFVASVPQADLAAVPVPVPVAAVWDASDAVTEIYKAHYNQLVRLAVMLVHDVQTAEEVVQDAFEDMHLAWRRLRDSEKALSFLRKMVVNRSRSVLRHRKVVEMHAPKPAPDEQSAEHAALTLIERSAVTSALRALPERQREAIVLRFYGDFSEADIAKAMGISKGALQSYTARAIAALKSNLEQDS